MSAPTGRAPAVLVGAPTVVVLGMMTKIPVAGVVWQVVHYLEGLRRLGEQVNCLKVREASRATRGEQLARDGGERGGARGDRP